MWKDQRCNDVSHLKLTLRNLWQVVCKGIKGHPLSTLLTCFILVALLPPALWFIQLLCNHFGQGLPVSVCLTSIMRYWFCLDVTVIWVTSVLFISYKFWESWLSFLLCFWTLSPRKYLISSIAMTLGCTQKTWLFSLLLSLFQILNP